MNRNPLTLVTFVFALASLVLTGCGTSGFGRGAIMGRGDIEDIKRCTLMGGTPSMNKAGHWDCDKEEPTAPSQAGPQTASAQPVGPSAPHGYGIGQVVPGTAGCTAVGKLDVSFRSFDPERYGQAVLVWFDDVLAGPCANLVHQNRVTVQDRDRPMPGWILRNRRDMQLTMAANKSLGGYCFTAAALFWGMTDTGQMGWMLSGKSYHACVKKGSLHHEVDLDGITSFFQNDELPGAVAIIYGPPPAPPAPPAPVAAPRP